MPACLQLAASDAEHADQDLAIFLQDKEALKSTLSSSNDMHVGKLIATEDSMREQFSKSVSCRSLMQRVAARARVCVCVCVCACVCWGGV